MSDESAPDARRQSVRSRLANILDNATRYLRSAGRRPEPEDPPMEPWHVTRKGKGIMPVSASEWYSDATSATEFKHHVGKSVEGFHGGLEISYHGGEGPFYWSNARRTPEAAEKASYGIRGWYEKDEPVKNYPPMSEGQEHDAAVFKAADDLGKALHARTQGRFEDWKRLERGVERSIGNARKAFREQRQFVSREVAEGDAYLKTLAPNSRPRKKARSWDR
jgi:hypothetical protein